MSDRYVDSSLGEPVIYPSEFLKLAICRSLVILIGFCIVGKYSLYLYARHLPYLLDIIDAIIIAGETDPAHSCIHLYVYLRTLAHADSIIRQLLRLIHIIHGRTYIPSHEIHVIRRICVTKYQYRLIYSRLPELYSLIEKCHSIIISQIVQCSANFDSSMSICIRLYDRQHLFVLIHKRFHGRHVMSYIVKIYYCLYSVKAAHIHAPFNPGSPEVLHQLYLGLSSLFFLCTRLQHHLLVHVYTLQAVQRSPV